MSKIKRIPKEVSKFESDNKKGRGAVQYIGFGTYYKSWFYNEELKTESKFDKLNLFESLKESKFSF